MIRFTINNLRLKILLLALIMLVAGVLRFWQLGKVPISPDWDEVALGYNAYSILHTGKDEYGKFLPVVLQSFDDYKPALYSYITIPSIMVFDLTVFAVRFPSAVLGTLTVLLVYFLIRELFKKNDVLALLVAFFLAISPWHIQFSRVAFETNVGLFFNIAMVLCLLVGRRKPWLLIVAALCFSLSIYTYQSEKVFTPLFALLAVIIYRKELFSLPKKYIITTLLIGLITILPMISYIVTNKNALARAQGVSIFGSTTQFLYNDTQKIIQDQARHDKISVILDNRRILFAKTILDNYLSHFSLNWLFIKGDNPRHHAPEMGLLYLWELPFLFIGLYMLLFGNFDKKTKIFIISWFLLAPVPASITTGVPHAVRTLNFLPTFQIFTAIGLVTVISKLSALRGRLYGVRYLFYCLLITVALFNFVYYLNQYFVQQNYYMAPYWQYGYQQLVSEVQKIQGKYDKIIVSNKPVLDQSYMFFLFYLKYPPAQYQKDDNTTAGFKETHQFGKYEFRPINWEEDRKIPNAIYIGNLDDFPQPRNRIDEIYYPDGTSAMEIVENVK